MKRLVLLSAIAMAAPACGGPGKAPAAPKPHRPKEVKEDKPVEVKKTDCEPLNVADQPASVPYAQRSIPESKNLSISGARMLRTAHSPKTPAADKEDLVIQAVKQLITALRADPYNVNATYNLAAAYAVIKRNRCSLNLLKRLVLLRKLDSQKAKVEAKVDFLLGRGKYKGRLDPDFRRLRDNADFRELVKQLNPIPK
jgi:hypothetical protein